MPSFVQGRLAEFFALFRRRLAAEAADDPEPDKRFAPAWYEWQKRHWDRDRRRIELDEAEALSTYPEDPAPLAIEGLEPFLAWSVRQEKRRRLRRSA